MKRDNRVTELLFKLLYTLVSLLPLLIMWSFYLLFTEVMPCFLNFEIVSHPNLIFETILHHCPIYSIWIGTLLVSLIFFIVCFWKSQNSQIEVLTYDSLTSLSNEALNFFLSLSLCFSTAEKWNIPWMGILFATIFLLSMRLNDFKVNLFLWFWGYKQYTTSNSKRMDQTLITKKDLLNQSGKINVIKLTDNLFMEKL